MQEEHHYELELALNVTKIPPKPSHGHKTKTVSSYKHFGPKLFRLAHLLHLISTCGNCQVYQVESVGGVKGTRLFGYLFFKVKGP